MEKPYKFKRQFLAFPPANFIQMTTRVGARFVMSQGMTNRIVLLAALFISSSQAFASNVETIECGPLIPTQELAASATFFNVGAGAPHVALFLPVDGSALKKYTGNCKSEAGPLLPSLTCEVEVADYEYTVTLADRGEHGLIATYAPSMSMEIPEMLSCQPRK
jgi:hypothetical protein